MKIIVITQHKIQNVINAFFFINIDIAISFVGYIKIISIYFFLFALSILMISSI